MSNTNELTNRINQAYSSMSKGQKLLATYITDNYDKAVFLTAAKLGNLVARQLWERGPVGIDAEPFRTLLWSRHGWEGRIDIVFAAALMERLPQKDRFTV